MDLIIKQNIDHEGWAQLFIANESKVDPSGFISNAAMDKMARSGILTEIDPIKIVDKYWRHRCITASIAVHKYFTIGLPISILQPHLQDYSRS